jgi:transcriptional regulator with XRE-family HTH domain
MKDLYEYSTPEIVRHLGSLFKEYRLRAGMTQKDVAEQSGLTITTIHNFESGVMNNISLSTFILLLKAIGYTEGLEKLLPELPESPYLIRLNKKKTQRIRHKKS